MTDRLLVTGGAGFIGSHLVRALLERGDRVTVLDNFSTGSRENLEGLGGNLEVLEGSCTDPGDLETAFAGVRGVFHLAAVPSVARSVENPLEAHVNNATGTIAVLDKARSGAVKVVYAGSSSAYGDQDTERKKETQRESPLSPYAAAKLSGELYCRSFSQVYRIPIVVTRFFNAFGPRQVPDSPYSGVIAAFCLALVTGDRPRIDGDGGQSRDFTYVANVVDGVCLAMERELQGCPVVNVATGDSHTVLELLALLQAHAGVHAQPTHAPPRAGDVQHSRADIGAARELLGYQPRVSFAEGLARTYDWYRSIYS